MDLSTQKKMAAKVLDCGVSKVWINPNLQEEVADAITRADIRRLVQKGAIKKVKSQGQSKGRSRKIKRQKSKGRRKGHGSRKGKSGTRKTDKEKWMSDIRAQRKFIKELKGSGKIDNDTYRNLYGKAKGGFFHSKKHLEEYLRKENLLKGE